MWFGAENGGVGGCAPLRVKLQASLKKTPLSGEQGLNYKKQM